MLAYLPNPISRPSAVLEKSSSLFLTPILFVILVYQIYFCNYFHHWGQFSCFIYLPNPKQRPSTILEKSSSLFLTPLSHAIHLMLLILVCRIHFLCYFHHCGQFVYILTYQI